MTEGQGRVLRCEHLLCEFTEGHPRSREHWFTLGLYTHLEVCQECYYYLIGAIIGEEIEHLANRLAAHSRGLMGWAAKEIK